MISETTVHRCTRCDLNNIFKNGHNKSGNPQFRCKDCGRSSVIKPKIKYTDEQKELIICTYLERGSLRGMRRLFGVSPAILTSWIKKASTPIKTTLLPAQTDDVLKLDELWSYFHKRDNKLWNWIALCHRTRQVVAYVCGDRDSATCRDLRCRIPDAYSELETCGDYWSSYAEVFDPDTYQSVGKHTGLTNHVELFNATARHRLGRLTRKTFSLSKTKKLFCTPSSCSTIMRSDKNTKYVHFRHYLASSWIS